MSQTDAGRFGSYTLRSTPAAANGDTVATDETGRVVWLRAVPDEWARDPVRRAAFDADHQRLGQVAAPGIATSETVVTDGPRTALALDAPVATLVDLTAGARRFPTHQAARFGVELADALAAAHGAGVIHGALTPDAVVQAADGRLQLRHFGFASDPLAVADAAMWTAYAAPEQLLDGAPDERSDLYALGGILYLLVTGGPPFPDFDPDALRIRKLEDAPPAPSRDEPLIPAALDGLIQRLLARDPGRRPESAAVVSAELRRLTQPTDTVRPRPVIVDEIVTTGEERTSAWPLVAAILGTLLVAAIVLVVILANDDGDTNRVTVPSVVGRPAATAAATLTRRHLGVTTVDRADSTVPAGQVLAQDPVPGAHVRRNRVIVLTVSTPAPVVTPLPVPVPVSPSVSSTTSTSTTTTSTTSTTTATAPPP